MSRFISTTLLVCLCFSLTACPTTSADVLEVQAVDALGGRTGGVVYKLSITPAKEAVPAFKYRLTVEPHKTIPGNAITHYLRSLGENSLRGLWEWARLEFGQDVHDWYSLKTPAKDIPLESLRKVSAKFEGYVENHLRRATLCRESDWGLAMEDLRGREALAFLLPSVQQTRSMSRILALKNRLAVIEGRYDDSVDYLRMNYQLGQNVSQMNVLVTNLVGLAEVGIANAGMLDLIAAKDSPNMYWALMELPTPIISIRNAVRLESSFGTRYFPELLDVENAKHSPGQWGEILAEMVGSLTEVHGLTGGRSSMDGAGQAVAGLPLALALSGYSAAKQRLIEGGDDEAEVNQMSAAQVLLIDAARDYELMANEVEKEYYVPFQVVEKFSYRLRDRKFKGNSLRLGMILGDAILPAVQQVRQAEVRVQTNINVLIAIEAIRHHVATKGEFPTSLEEMDLPVRNSGFTDKPFEYRVEGRTAVLVIPKSRLSGQKQRYEISIAPKS
ncbi:MAG: hypothetical protein ACI87E_000217 [Mariniblastus sp.]|jgi:hypothetical protein